MKQLVAAILLLAAGSAPAHRLDEYLQATIVSVEKNRLDAQMTLTPGVSVYPAVIAGIDTDRDGVISKYEERTYAGRVLGDLSIVLDGHKLTPQLSSTRFPALDEMKEGRGQIQLEFTADLLPGGAERKLTIVNRHETPIAAYQVNCLVPRDRDIRILAQNRNYTQSFYELDFVDASASSRVSGNRWLPGGGKTLELAALALSAWLALVWKLRGRLTRDL